MCNSSPSLSIYSGALLRSFVAALWVGLATITPSDIANVNANADVNAQIHSWSNLGAVRHIIVKFKSNVSSSSLPTDAVLANHIARVSQRAAITLAPVRELADGAQVLRLPTAMSYDEANRIARNIAQATDVVYAEPDVLTQVHANTSTSVVLLDARAHSPKAVPNDFYYAKQWNLKAVDSGASTFGINAEPAWAITTGNPNLVIAVIDTGVISTHPDLTGRLLPGYDFVSNIDMANDGDGRDADASDPGDWNNSNECGAGSPARDSSWHGTFVIGVLAAASNNGIGIAALDQSSKVLPVRALGRCGGQLSDIVDAMRWAAGLTVAGVPNNPTPARIINLSLNTLLPCSAIYQEAIDAVNQAGAIVVVSAGNNGLNVALSQPANCNNVIRVAATTRAGALASYSNSGSLITIAAPGGELSSGEAGSIFSVSNAGKTNPGQHVYALTEGSSVAAPQVAALIALMLSVNPMLSREQVISLLQSSVTAFPALAPCTPTTCGPGLCNAGAAVAAAQNFTSVTFSRFVHLPAVLR